MWFRHFYHETFFIFIIIVSFSTSRASDTAANSIIIADSIDSLVVITKVKYCEQKYVETLVRTEAALTVVYITIGGCSSYGSYRF